MVDEERNPIHEEFISALPEELQEDAGKYVEHWDKYVQDKFGENAEEIKGWEPYSNIQVDENTAINIRDIPPEELAELLAWREIANDPEELAKYSGEQEVPEDPQVAQLLQQVTELSAWKQQQEQQSAQMAQEAQVAQAQTWVDSELGKIKEQYPKLSDQDIDDICALASRYEPADDVIQKGFKDFQEIVARTEREFFQKKAGQPRPAESGGAPNTAAEPIRTYDDASEAARMRLRESLGR